MNATSTCLSIAIAVLGATVTAAQSPPASPPATQPQPQAQSQPAPGAKSVSATGKPHSHADRSVPGETRPDALYPHPSGQDSHPKGAPTVTNMPEANSTRGMEKLKTKAPDQPSGVKRLAARKAYTGATGRKQDLSTVCSTARATKDGGVDCGTSGDGATLGKIVTK